MFTRFLRVDLMVVILFLHTLAYAGTTTRVSVSSSGIQGNNDCYSCALSADGRYVAFESNATNLIPGDNQYYRDVFVHDKQNGQTTIISLTYDGRVTSGDSLSPTINASGRYVAFASWSSEIIPQDTNNAGDIFVRDQQSAQTTCVSVSSSGIQGNASSGTPTISADGRYVAFASNATNLVSGDTNGTTDIFVRDRQTAQTTCVSTNNGTQGNGPSSYPTISADGRFVAFESKASNLATGATNGFTNCFVHDRQTGQTICVSVNSTGEYGNNDSRELTLSADGRYTAFNSYASNLVTGDTNYKLDIFLHDRQTMQITRVSVNSNGVQGNGNSIYPSLSADGRYIAFTSFASNFVAVGTHQGGGDIFILDRQTAQISLISTSINGVQGTSLAGSTSISPDGRFVAFDHYASNLVPGDTNNVEDVFIHDRGTSNVYKADLLTRIASEGNYSGDNIYSLDGINQKKMLDMPANETAMYLFRVQNDGNANDSFTVTGSPGASGWTVLYKRTDTGADITSTVTGAGWNTGSLAPGAVKGIYVQVVPWFTLPAGAGKVILLTATSAGNTTKKDVVKTVTTVSTRHQPDLWIRKVPEANFGGNNIYNINGNDQTRTASVPANTAVTYAYRVQNDGNITDSFTVTAPAGGNGWTVQYYTNAGANITAAITGSGWSTSTLTAGTTAGIYVKVIPTTAVSGSTQTVLLTVTSTSDGTRKDAVKSVTTRQ